MSSAPSHVVLPNEHQVAQAQSSELDQLRHLAKDDTSPYWTGPRSRDLQARMAQLTAAPQGYGHDAIPDAKPADRPHLAAWGNHAASVGLSPDQFAQASAWAMRTPPSQLTEANFRKFAQGLGWSPDEVQAAIDFHTLHSARLAKG